MSDYGWTNHRADFRTCPSCDHFMDYQKWFDESAVSMTTSIVFGKHGSAAILSECPKCGASSWVHYPLDSITPHSPYKWPKNWISRAKVALKRRREKALMNWEQGLCKSCKHLESSNITTHAWRNCIVGSGPAETECEEFDNLDTQ